jgi:hypothetical protein
MPEIQMEGDSVTFTFELADLASARLTVRCDGRGDVFAAIVEPTSRPSYPFTGGD